MEENDAIVRVVATRWECGVSEKAKMRERDDCAFEREESLDQFENDDRSNDACKAS